MSQHAVSAIIQQPTGKLLHYLHVVSAESTDAAEARILSRLLREGREVRGLLSLAVDEQPACLTPTEIDRSAR